MGPIYIVRELFAKNLVPLRETVLTMVRQQLVLTPWSYALNLVRSSVFKTSRRSAFEVALADAVLGAVMGYFLQLAWLNKPGELTVQLLQKLRLFRQADPGSILRPETDPAAISRSLLGQARQAIVRKYFGVSPGAAEKK